MKFLIDECLHTSLTTVSIEAGHEAHHVVYRGWAGLEDHELRTIILREEFVFVTNNGRDFRGLLLHQEGFTIVGANRYIRENGIDPSNIESASAKTPPEPPSKVPAPSNNDTRRALAEVRRDLESIDKMLGDDLSLAGHDFERSRHPWAPSAPFTSFFLQR